MKKLLLPFALFVSLASTALRLAPGTLSPDERKFAIDYFEKTKARLLADVKGLSANQLNWKADTNRWSVYQCTEHIALSEQLFWQWIQMTERQPATPDKRSEDKNTTDDLITKMTDRSHKFQAPEMLRPATQFASEDAALQAFVLRRDSTIDYIKATQDDLKDHFVNHPLFGTVDLYQVLILLAAHSARHTAQLEEVMASPGFPKQ
jgi:DinB superfamily